MPPDLGQEKNVHRSLPFPVVGIGASAGGLDAVLEFLAALAPDTGMAYVLVQHMEPHHESHLAEILARGTKMPVLSVTEGTRVEPNHFYVVTPNSMLAMKDGFLRLSARNESLNQYHGIDHFFFSLAEDMGMGAIGVILSGSASDGAEGIRAIRSASGTTFCQTEDSAKFGGMPHSALATGAVDFILPPHQIAAELARISRHPYVGSTPPAETETGTMQDRGALRKIFSLLQNATRVNFNEYKQNTIQRRIARRMLVHGSATVADYAALLERDRAEISELYRDILITVTQFFRDAGTFESLARNCAGMLEKRDGKAPFRIWSAGCASGEEAYSLVICALEVLEAAGRTNPVQLFGTDINDRAIDTARAAIYPDLIEKDISPERLSRFFTRVESGYRISRTIRESCVFARHDLIRDPPFSQLDVVSCRNVLIYFNSSAQRRALPALHYGLKPEGLLVLGSAESVGDNADLFEVVDSENKIFSKRQGTYRFSMTLPDPPALEYTGDRKLLGINAAVTLPQVETRANRMLRDLYAPPGVTINDSMQILHFHGQTSLYLEPPSGEASLNLLRVAHWDLVQPLRKAIDAAAASKEPVTESGIRFERNGEQREVSVRVIPLFEKETRYYLVLFESGKVGTSVPRSGASSESDIALEVELMQARREVDNTREYLRKISEEHEVAIEELRAAHEEVQSSNEEMQSTNEELRTAKEELQSSNEELNTVNDELRNRNTEIGAANNDLLNVLNAVSIPIIMVGMDFRIRRFTPAAERLLDTGPSDLGRVVTEIRLAMNVPKLREMLIAAVDTLAVQESKVQSNQGRWYSVAVRPYRTLEDRIDGAVISFVDIDDVTRALEVAEAARDFAEGMVETVQHPLLVLDENLRIQRATAAFYKTFQVSPTETTGEVFSRLGNGQWNVPRLHEKLEEAAERDVPLRDFEVEGEFPQIGRRSMRVNAKRIGGVNGDKHRILLSIDDVTERKEAAEIQYRRLFESSKDAIVIVDGHTGQVIDVNPYFLELTRYPRLEIVRKPFWELEPFRKSEEGARLVPEAMAKETVRYDSVPLQPADGRRLIGELIANRYRVKEQTFIQVNIRDVTYRRQVEEDLRRSNLDLQQFAFAASHDLQEPLRTVINQVQFLEKRYRGKLDADADEMIHFITSATDRMRHMVLDLLSFAQTARANITIAATSSEAILATALSNLQLAIQTTGAQITFDPLPTVWMDATQLLQLLQNLIGNALKYRGPEPPRIHISAKHAGAEWIFSVKDNGLGFDPKFKEHIFTVFKRLHGPEYVGTGIGLATCKRIVERHGGRIWAESEVGKGSTFFFAIQIPPSDQ